MEAKEVRSLKWVSVADWDKLTMTRTGCWGVLFVGESDIDSFVENLFKDVALQLNIPYSELEPILREENSAFYSTKSRLFKPCKDISKSDNCLLELEKMLRIPDVTSILDDSNKSSVDKILNDFSDLTDTEKLEVLQRLSKVSVKIDFLTE